jgi:hypothetical protein
LFASFTAWALLGTASAAETSAFIIQIHMLKAVALV